MAGVAAFAKVDVAAGKLEWRIDAHVGCVFHGLVNGEERRDLDEAADARDQDDRERQPDRLAFHVVVKSENRHGVHSAGCSAPAATGVCGTSPAVLAATPGCRMVIQTL